MKKYILILLLLPVTHISAQQLTADQVIHKTIGKLASLKTVSYDYRRELNYVSERFFHELKAAAYLDFTSAGKVPGVKYRFAGDSNSNTYNGAELFSLDGKNKTIHLNSKPVPADFQSDSYLVNSPVTLKNVLPKIVADKTVPRSFSEIQIDKKDFYVIEFALDKFGVDLFGNFSDQKLARKITYRVTVSKDQFMPVEVLQKNGDIDFIKTTFSNLRENPAPPAENTWYYSTYLGEYKFAEPSKDNLIRAGAIAPDFTLPFAGSEREGSLSSYRGKVVLLEFWIFHCGACIAAVPQLNAIHEKYKDKDLKLLSVNIYDSKELVDFFIASKKVDYPVLYTGEAAAKQYGVDRYPIVVLIGKDGKVIFSGIFDAAKIDALIQKNL